GAEAHAEAAGETQVATARVAWTTAPVAASRGASDSGARQDASAAGSLDAPATFAAREDALSFPPSEESRKEPPPGPSLPAGPAPPRTASASTAMLEKPDGARPLALAAATAL